MEYQVTEKTPLVTKVKSVKQMTTDVCKNTLGEIGQWQLRSIFLISLVKIPSAWHMASILFTAPTPGQGNFWCAQPLEYQHWDVQRWINLSHPVLPGDTNLRDPCNIYDMAYEILTEDEDSEYPNTTNIHQCKEFEFKTTHTVVKQWNLVCGREVLVSVSQFFYLFGILVGGILCWRLLYRFSPRRVLLSAMMVQVIAGISIAFIPNLELHIFMRFVTAMACANMFTCGYVICTDITNGKWRTIIGACYEHMWSVGVITLACLALAFNNWPDLQLAISIPTALILLFCRWIPDSPRWLINNGFYEEAKIILEDAAEFNRIKTIIDIPLQDNKRKSSNTRWKDIFKPPGNMWIVCPLHIVWAATVVTYYGALLNVKNLGENLIVNTGIAGFAEIIGVVFGLVLLLQCEGKWLSLGMLLIVGGCTCIMCWCIPTTVPAEYLDAIMMTLGMTGRIAIACSLTLLQVSSAELLPESHRPIGIVSCVIFARIFLLSAPFIGSLAMYGTYVSLSAFGAITVIGGIASLVLHFTTQEKCMDSTYL